MSDATSQIRESLARYRAARLAAAEIYHKEVEAIKRALKGEAR